MLPVDLKYSPRTVTLQPLARQFYQATTQDQKSFTHQMFRETPYRGISALYNDFRVSSNKRMDCTRDALQEQTERDELLLLMRYLCKERVDADAEQERF